MSDENDGGIDRREAIAIGAAARYMGGQARQQAAHEAAGATRHPQPRGSGLVTFLVVAVVLVGTLATMIALGR